MRKTQASAFISEHPLAAVEGLCQPNPQAVKRTSPGRKVKPGLGWNHRVVKESFKVNLNNVCERINRLYGNPLTS